MDYHRSEDGKRNQCILLGCDSNHEWMLPWWYKHYKAHNEYPVVFADFGMTKQSRRWCKVRGRVIQINKKYKKNTCNNYGK